MMKSPFEKKKMLGMISYIIIFPSPLKTVGGVKEKIMTFLQQTQPKIIKNQCMLTMCIQVGRTKNKKQTCVKKY